MKKILTLLCGTLFLLLFSCSSNDPYLKEAKYLGLTGKFDVVEAEYRDADNRFSKIEVYSFNKDGYIEEVLTYLDPKKKTIEGRTTYTRDENNRLIEFYYGFNLSNERYMIEVRRELVSRENNKEHWAWIKENSKWGKSYLDITIINDNETIEEEYTITTKDNEKTNIVVDEKKYDSKSAFIYSKRTQEEGEPKHVITELKYNDFGHQESFKVTNIRQDGSESSQDLITFEVITKDKRFNPTEILNTNTQERTLYTYHYINN